MAVIGKGKVVCSDNFENMVQNHGDDLSKKVSYELPNAKYSPI